MRHKKPTKAEVITARIIVKLITTAPLAVGTLATLASSTAYQADNITLTAYLAICAVSFALVAVAVKAINFFES